MSARAASMSPKLPAPSTATSMISTSSKAASLFAKRAPAPGPLATTTRMGRLRLSGPSEVTVPLALALADGT